MTAAGRTAADRSRGQRALWRFPPGRKIRDDLLDEPSGLAPPNDTPLQATSRREGIVRPCLDHPRLPEQDSADHPSRQEGPKNNQLNAEEQKRDDDEYGGEYGDHQQSSFLEVNPADPLAKPG